MLSKQRSRIQYLLLDDHAGALYTVLTAGKDGLLWKIDRRNGKYLGVVETVFQNVWQIDRKTGSLKYRPDIQNAKVNDWISSCPSTQGGKNWPAGTYSPIGNVMFFPLQNTCMTSTPTLSRPSLDSLYGLRNANEIAPNRANVGSIHAISAETGKTLWTYEQRAAMLSLLSTAGGLVFTGEGNGKFKPKPEPIRDTARFSGRLEARWIEGLREKRPLTAEQQTPRCVRGIRPGVRDSSHLGDVERLCRRVVVIDQGHIVHDGSVGDLVRIRPGERSPVDGVVVDGASTAQTTSELAGAMRRALDTLRSQFDRIVIDTPPATPTAPHTRTAASTRRSSQARMCIAS